MEKCKLVFTKDGLTISGKKRSPLDGNIRDIEIDKKEYGSLQEIKDLNMHVTAIKPKIEADTLKELIFDVEFESKFISQEITPNIHDEMGIKIGNKKIPCRKYNEILINVTKWLFDNDRIRKKDLPIYGINSRQYLLNSEPKHPSNKPFAGQRLIDDGVYLNITWSAPNTKKQARYLMDIFAPDINFQIFGSK
jgi:hypothetical protein